MLATLYLMVDDIPDRETTRRHARRSRRECTWVDWFARSQAAVSMHDSLTLRETQAS